MAVIKEAFPENTENEIRNLMLEKGGYHWLSVFFCVIIAGQLRIRGERDDDVEREMVY